MKRFLMVFVITICSVFFLGAAPTVTAPPPVHTVQKGDTLGKIAAKYMPYTAAYTKKELINSIKAINDITGPLSLGQNLNIPIAWQEPLKPKTVVKAKDYSAKGLYMNTSSSGTRFIFDSAQKLRKLNGNTIVFDAKDDMGAITYPSTIPDKYCPNENYTPNIEELPKLVDYLHRINVHVVARVVVFRDPIMTRTRPEWCINKEKNWLDPANPEVQDYILTVVKELCESGVDEIQLDYVRYFADLKTDTGKEGISRTDVIAGFVKRVHDITSPKGILLSLDMFGIVVWQRDVDVLTVGQDVMKLKNHVEIISPMLYPSHFSPGFSGFKNPADEPYQFVFSGVKRMKDLVGDDVIIRPWLQSFPLRVTKGFDAKYIQDQIDASRDAGGNGWLLWSPGNKYKDAYIAMQNVKDKPDKNPAPGVAAEMKPKGKNTMPQQQPDAKDALQPASSPLQNVSPKQTNGSDNTTGSLPIKNTSKSAVLPKG